MLLTFAGEWVMMVVSFIAPSIRMSEEQLSALLAKLKENAGLKEKLQCAVDLDAAVAIVKDAGFDVTKADWLRYQAKQTLELSDEELEGVAGGKHCDGTDFGSTDGGCGY
jgi:predicted ribosomally synthesized peptide with nif11-like leader